MAEKFAPRAPGRHVLLSWTWDQSRGRRCIAHHGSRGELSGRRHCGWTEQGLPTRRSIGTSPSKWVTREHPKIDRIACPWLIRRFIDPNAEFIYVPKDQVIAIAKRIGGTPYDIDGVEFTHEGVRCSFDSILRIYGIKDPALDHLATIVRGCRYVAARSGSSMRRLVRDLARSLGEFSG
jgi:hypothetical protein